MNSEMQIALLRELHKDEGEVLLSKGNDYASEGDVLKNFKEVSTICSMLGIDSRQLYGTHMFYIVLKIQRICNLLFSNKKPSNESIQDTLMDLRNYIFLLQCSLVEEKINEEQNKKAP